MKRQKILARLTMYAIGSFALLMLTSHGSIFERLADTKSRVQPLYEWGKSLPNQVVNGLVPPAVASTDGPASSALEVAFSPGGAEALVLRAINESTESILLAAYSFTSRNVANALLAATKRGVDVRIVLDDGQDTAKYSKSRYIAKRGVPTRLNSHYAIMHNKFMVLDGDTVQTGSYNYTASAAHRNAENVIVIKHHKELAAIYQKEWLRLWNQSEPFRP